ncbi:hypothetical protein GOQ30_14780 [Flavobacterium sp. TP390]|uniref:Uncharacterized protein n=1 Tax=Flavobacterium profundi TaxID=1774945 RepID=A0A6I4IU63_9FLAO|nr:hypothetical protein [Flavobacterium profundi]MVO10437.1 hypothetical protein [Flavobacterium profundi]
MFSFFKNKNKHVIPEFEFINTFSEKDFYFVRTKQWMWITKEEIALVHKDEKGSIKTTTMDFWYQEMFLDADGEKTISEYLLLLIKQFQDSKMQIPDDLDQFMIETLLSLKNDLNAIEFTQMPNQPKEEFKNPIE